MFPRERNQKQNDCLRDTWAGVSLRVPFFLVFKGKPRGKPQHWGPLDSRKNKQARMHSSLHHDNVEHMLHLAKKKPEACFPAAPGVSMSRTKNRSMTHSV